MKRIRRFISDKNYRFLVLANLNFYDKMSDEEFLKRKFYAIMNKKLNIDDPKTFNEKLQWLKVNDRKPIYTILADKYAVRQYISEKLGEEYLIPLIGTWENPDDIDFEALPSQFVLKCNHNSGVGMVICKDKSRIDIRKVKRELRRGLRQNYYLVGREWPYKDIKHRVVAEKYIQNSSASEELTDYKFFCFNGKVDCVMVCCDRATGDTKYYFMDREWKLKRINKRGKEAPEDFTIERPERLDEMFSIAEKLSENFAFIRIDLYESLGKIYFGEMTFFPQSGFDNNLLPETDLYFGNLIDLKSHKIKKEEVV